VSLWYCCTYPVAALSAGPTEFSHRAPYLPALLEHIREHGLVNPLIVLNHRDPKSFVPRTVMTGTNRLWCVRQLGWEIVPALVQGPVDDVWHLIGPVPVRDIRHAQQFFSDGELYMSASGNLRLRGFSNFVKGEFPNVGRGQGMG
jgi:ParB-like nuclease family protein